MNRELAVLILRLRYFVREYETNPANYNAERILGLVRLIGLSTGRFSTVTAYLAAVKRLYGGLAPEQVTIQQAYVAVLRTRLERVFDKQAKRWEGATRDGVRLSPEGVGYAAKADGAVDLLKVAALTKAQG